MLPYIFYMLFILPIAAGMNVYVPGAPDLDVNDSIGAASFSSNRKDLHPLRCCGCLYKQCAAGLCMRLLFPNDALMLRGDIIYARFSFIRACTVTALQGDVLSDWHLPSG